MAFPQVATSSNGATASSTSHTVTLPASIAIGDLILIFFAARFASTPKTAGYTWTAGYTELEDEAFDTSGNSAHLGISYRVADGSEGASMTVTTAAASEGAYAAYRITGAHASSPPEKGAVFTSASGNVPDPPNVTPSWGAADTLWIVVDSRNTAGGSTLTSWPTNYTANQIDIPSATLVRLNVASRELNAASENPGTFTFSSGQFEAANTVAVRPAAPPSVVFSHLETIRKITVMKSY